MWPKMHVEWRFCQRLFFNNGLPASAVSGNLRIMTRTNTRRVVLLAHDQMNLLDLAGPLQALSTASRRFSGVGPALYETRVASVNGGLVVTSAGLPIETVALSSLDGIAIDTLIVPGGSKDSEMHAPPQLIAWIASRAMPSSSRSRAVAKVCCVVTIALPPKRQRPGGSKHAGFLVARIFRAPAPQAERTHQQCAGGHQQHIYRRPQHRNHKISHGHPRRIGDV